MLQTIIFFVGFMCISVNSEGLAIDFIWVRADNSTYIVNEIIADKTGNERLQIICRISSISNLVSFKYTNLSKLTSHGREQMLATMQDDLPEKPGYQTPYLSPGSGINDIQAVWRYNRTNPTIGISIPVSSLSCDNDTYQCQLLYEYDGWPTEPIVERQANISRILTVADPCPEKPREHIDAGKLVALITGVAGCIILVAAFTVLIRKWRKMYSSDDRLLANDNTHEFTAASASIPVREPRATLYSDSSYGRGSDNPGRIRKIFPGVQSTRI